LGTTTTPQHQAKAPKKGRNFWFKQTEKDSIITTGHIIHVVDEVFCTQKSTKLQAKGE
jgi:hypothetical protein